MRLATIAQHWATTLAERDKTKRQLAIQFGEEMDKAIGAAGLSRVEVARRLNLSSVYLCDIALGRRGPVDVEMARRIEEAISRG